LGLFYIRQDTCEENGYAYKEEQKGVKRCLQGLLKR
jgi:hypothetical protein